MHKRSFLAAVVCLAAAPTVVVSPAQARPVGQNHPSAPAFGEELSGTEIVTGLHVPVTGKTATEAASAFVAKQHTTLAKNESTLVPIGEQRAGSETVVRFEQRFSGIPVVGAQFVVRMTGFGSSRVVTGTSSTVQDDLKVDTKITPISVTTSTKAARRVVPAGSRDQAKMTDRGLAILPTGLGRIVRHLTVSSTDPRTHRPILREVYVDSRTGAVLLNTSSLRFAEQDVATSGESLRGKPVPIHVTKRDKDYVLEDRSRAGQDRPTLFTYDAQGKDAMKVAGEPASAFAAVTTDAVPVKGAATRTGAVDALRGAEVVTDFYHDRLGRNGLDGKGSPISSVVGVTAGGEPLANAFWDGVKMVYGTGGDGYKPFSASLDVVAHEMTHGVTSSSARFMYVGQSGALDEAFADYFGNAIQVTNDKIPMTSPLAGLLGEDLCLKGKPQDCAVRNLHNTMTTGKDFIGTTDDEAGVHINAPIPGGAMWQVREAIDPALADRIIYHALVGYLAPMSTFTDLRRAVLDAAKAEGATAAQQQVVAKAFDAHGIVDGWEDKLGTDAKVIVPRLSMRVGRVGAGGDRWVTSDMGVTGDELPAIYTGSISKPAAPQRLTPRADVAYEGPDTDGIAIAYVGSTIKNDDLVTTLYRHEKAGDPAKPISSSADGEIFNIGVAGPATVWTAVTPHGDALERDVFVKKDAKSTPVNLTPAVGVQGFGAVISGTTVAYFTTVGKDTGATTLETYDLKTGKRHQLKAPNTEGKPSTIDRIAISPKHVVWTMTHEGSEGKVSLWMAAPDLTHSAQMRAAKNSVIFPEISTSDVAVTLRPMAEAEDKPTNAGQPHLLQQDLKPGAKLKRVSCNRGASGPAAALNNRRVIFLDITKGYPQLILRDAPTEACRP